MELEAEQRQSSPQRPAEGQEPDVPPAEDEAAQLLLGLVGGPPPPLPEPVAKPVLETQPVEAESRAISPPAIEPAVVPETETSPEVKMDVDEPAHGEATPVLDVVEAVEAQPPAVEAPIVQEPYVVETTVPTSEPAKTESTPPGDAPPPIIDTDMSDPTAEQPSPVPTTAVREPSSEPTKPIVEQHPVDPVPASTESTWQRPQDYQRQLSPPAAPFKSISPNSLAHLLHPESQPIYAPAPLQIHMIPAKPISPPPPSVSFSLPAEQPQPVASTSYIPPAAVAEDAASAARPVKKRKRQPANPRRTSGSKAAAVEPPAEDGVIRCVCMLVHDDGFTIQCDNCQTWQHAVCMGIQQDAVPDIYRCDRCSDRRVDQRRAMQIQNQWLETDKARRAAEGAVPVRGAKAATRGRGKDREGSRGRLGSMALDDVEMGEGSGRDRASPAASTSSAMPPPGLPAKGKRRATQSKPRTKPARDHPTSIENFPSPFASAASASSAAFKEPATPASVQAQIQALSAGEDDLAWKAESWRLEYTEVRTNVIRGRAVHRAISGFLDEWTVQDEPVELERKRRRSSGTIQDASGLPSPAEPNHTALPEPGLPPPDLSILAPPIPPVYLSGSSLLSLESSTSVKPIPETSSFLPLGYSANPSAPRAVTAPAFMSAAVFSRPTTFGVFADQSITEGAYIGEYRGEVMQSHAYRRDPINQYAGLGMTKPFVHALPPPVDLIVDARGYGSALRFIRSGCHPNVVLRPVVFTSTSRSETQPTMSFGIFAARPLSKKEELVLGWEWDDQHVVHFLDVLSRCPRLENGRSHLPAIHPAKLQYLLDKIETILTFMLGTFSACACAVPMDCAVAQMAHLVETRGSIQGLDAVGKGGKPVDLGDLVGATRGWRRYEEELERMAKEEMLLAQEFQRREDAKRREAAQSEEDDDDDEDEEELPQAVIRPVTASRSDAEEVVEMGDTASPAKVEAVDFATKQRVVPESSPMSSPDPTPKAVKTKVNGVTAPPLVPDDDDDSGLASDTSTLTQPLSHRSSDSDNDSDESDAFSDAPPVSSPPRFASSTPKLASSPSKRPSPKRKATNLVHSGDDTEDEAPLRRHGKVVAKGNVKPAPAQRTPQGLKQSQARPGSKPKPNGVKKIRQILSPPAPASPKMPEPRPKPTKATAVEQARSKVDPRKKIAAKVTPAREVPESVVAPSAAEVQPEGGRTPTGPQVALPEEMPLPDVPSEALTGIFDEAPSAQVEEPSEVKEATPVPEAAPEPAEPEPEPVKVPTPPPVRRLTLADIIARRKATVPTADGDGEPMEVDESAPKLEETAAAGQDFDFDPVSGPGTPPGPPPAESPVRVELPPQAEPAPVESAVVEMNRAAQHVDSPLELSPRKNSEPGGFDWSKHLPSSSAYAAHLPSDSRETPENKHEAPWQPSPGYDRFRSLSSSSSNAPLTDAPQPPPPPAEPSWIPRPSWGQPEAKPGSPPFRPTAFPQTPQSGLIGLDLELNGGRPASPPSPPFVPRSRPPPPLLHRDAPPHQQPAGTMPNRFSTQESPVSQRTPLPPPGPRTNWPASAPPKEPPRGPRGWQAGPPQSPVNGPGSLPHRGPVTPSPGFGQPPNRGGYGGLRGPSSEYRGSRPWSRGRGRGRGWMA